MEPGKALQARFQHLPEVALCSDHLALRQDCMSCKRGNHARGKNSCCNPLCDCDECGYTSEEWKAFITANFADEDVFPHFSTEEIAKRLDGKMLEENASLKNLVESQKTLVAGLRAEMQKYQANNMELADANGILTSERNELLVENATMRRRLEDAERKLKVKR